MAKRKKRDKSERKIIVTRASGKKISIDVEEKFFKKTTYIKKSAAKRGISEEFAKRIKPEFEKFYLKKQGKKKKPRAYYFKIKMNLNLDGKRIKKFYSVPRMGLKSKKGFNLAMESMLSKLKKDITRYLLRQDMKTISILGVQSEVTNEAVLSKGARSARRKKSTKKRRKK